MMNIEKIVDKHGDELLTLKDSMHEMQLNLQSLLKDHKYLAVKVEQMSDNISTILVSQRELKDSVSVFSNYVNTNISWRAWFDRNWWKLVSLSGGLVMLLWGIMDFLYRLDPPK